MAEFVFTPLATALLVAAVASALLAAYLLLKLGRVARAAPVGMVAPTPGAPEASGAPSGEPARAEAAPGGHDEPKLRET